MALTVNNVGTLQLLNVLNKTSSEQESVLQRMATGAKINRGADDPAALLALTKLENELTSVDAGINNNQRTDAVLGVADNALTEIGNLVDEIQRLANETTNDAALTAEEIAANQAQIDDALSSIDRIVSTTNFNGKKLIDGSLGINHSVGTAGKITDVKVYSRRSDLDAAGIALSVKLNSAAEYATAAGVRTGGDANDGTIAITGKDGTAIVSYVSGESAASTVARVNQSVTQTGVSAHLSGGSMHLYSRDKGADAFVRVKLIEGAGVADSSTSGKDASVTVDGMNTAVDGDHVAYTANGINVAFDVGTLGTGSTVSLTIQGDGDGKSGATFQLGTNSDTRATLGIDGVYTAQLGNAATGYLKSIGSGGASSLINDPNQAAQIARLASRQVATLQGRIGGFQKFQVRTALNSLNDNKEGLEKARSVINDVDYAVESAELNRQNVLMQSAMSLLGLAQQQSSQVLSLLR
jgi:flagellin